MNKYCLFVSFSGEKMTEEEVETLLAGHEDANGCINYEGERERNKQEQDGILAIIRLMVCDDAANYSVNQVLAMW